MKPVLVLRHGDDIPLGLFGEALAAAGVAAHEVMLHHDESIPPLEEFSALIVLGGVMGVYDVATYPWLVDEKRTIREAHARGLPMFGICLGSQLFAEALGGSAQRGDGPPEIGYVTPQPTEEGRIDPVLRHFDRPAVVFHQDTWDLPVDATLLATSDRFPQAFRLGSVVAIQAHPEATSAILERWVQHPAELPLLEAAGVEPRLLVAEAREGETAQREMAARLFGAWVDEVVARGRLDGSSGVDGGTIPHVSSAGS